MSKNNNSLESSCVFTVCIFQQNASSRVEVKSQYLEEKTESRAKK
jgi:hypothetical protein